jgi:hypothetical protein
VLGAMLFAALCSVQPFAGTLALGDAGTSLAVLAALALAAAFVIAALIATLPTPGLTRLWLIGERGPDELIWQSDPSAAGHVRPRAPDHR